MWCAALVTWGMAAVAGMGIAVFAPDALPAVGVATAPAAATSTPRVAASSAKAAARRAVIADTPGARQRAADKAVAYAEARGWRSGIAIVDLSSGATTLAGDANGYFQTQSTVKLLIAARLLAEGRMSRAVSPAAHLMISASDDQAANALYPLAGGDGLVVWAASHYRLGRFGTPPVRAPGQWGSTQVTPAGMARFLVRARADGKAGPWLMEAMGDMTALAADGTSQLFGLRAADRLAVVKQGWGGDANVRDVEGTPSIGYVDGGRYAVAIYTSRRPEAPLQTAQSIVSAQARLLLPQGHVPRL